MGAVLPLHLPDINQPEVRLVHQCGCLKGVAHPFVAHVPASQAAQLPVDQGHQQLERGLITLAPGQQQLRDLRGT